MAQKKVASKAEAVKEAAAPAKKAVEEKVEKAVAATKSAAKKAEKKVAPVVEKAVSATKTRTRTAKKAVEKKVAEKKAELKDSVVLQVSGKEDIDMSAIVDACKADYKAKGHRMAKNVVVYVKPEENAAYYTVGGKGDADFKIEL